MCSSLALSCGAPGPASRAVPGMSAAQSAPRAPAEDPATEEPDAAPAKVENPIVFDLGVGGLDDMGLRLCQVIRVTGKSRRTEYRYRVGRRVMTLSTTNASPAFETVAAEFVERAHNRPPGAKVPTPAKTTVTELIFDQQGRPIATYAHSENGERRADITAVSYDAAGRIERFSHDHCSTTFEWNGAALHGGWPASTGFPSRESLAQLEARVWDFDRHPFDLPAALPFHGTVVETLRCDDVPRRRLTSSYDEKGRLVWSNEERNVELPAPGVRPELRQDASYQFVWRDTVLETSKTEMDVLKRTSTYEWRAGRVRSVRDQDGEWRRYEYDESGRTNVVRSPDETVAIERKCD
jgi:YD repeat-containing protein